MSGNREEKMQKLMDEYRELVRQQIAEETEEKWVAEKEEMKKEMEKLKKLVDDVRCSYEQVGLCREALLNAQHAYLTARNNSDEVEHNQRKMLCDMAMTSLAIVGLKEKEVSKLKEKNVELQEEIVALKEENTRLLMGMPEDTSSSDA